MYPSTLAESVWEVLNSQNKVDTAENNGNFQRSMRWKAIELPYLDDYDTSDWFLIDSSAMKDSLVWHEGVPLEFASTTDFDTFMRKYADYFVDGVIDDVRYFDRALTEEEILALYIEGE